MFEQLWEQDPRIRSIISKSEARGEVRGEVRGEARGEARGKLEGKVELVSSLVKQKFPNLAEEAQQKIRSIQKPEKLDELARFTISAPDEQSFLWVLETLAA